MVFNTPKFWYQERGIISFLLYPLSLLYQLIVVFKNFLTVSTKYPIKIICVGNANVGGSGKTPICILIANIFKENNVRVAFLSRGYGGDYSSHLKVDNSIHDAKLVGDEALILSRVAPVYVARNRHKGIKLAIEDGVDVVIMDDAMQNYQLVKDLTVMVIDGDRFFGNGLIIPAGPLRQPIDKALNEADCFVITDAKNRHHDLSLLPSKPIIYTNTLAINPENLPKDVVAFCGIGNPDKFYNLLEKLNINIIARKTFPDHYYYTIKDLDQLITMGENLLTTEKDYVKIPAKYRDKISYLPIEARSDQLDQFRDIFLSLLS